MDWLKAHPDEEVIQSCQKFAAEKRLVTAKVHYDLTLLIASSPYCLLRWIPTGLYSHCAVGIMCTTGSS